MQDWKSIPTALDTARRERGLSQEQLAKLVGETQQSLNRALRAHNSMTCERVVRYAHALGLRVDLTDVDR